MIGQCSEFTSNGFLCTKFAFSQIRRSNLKKQRLSDYVLQIFNQDYQLLHDIDHLHDLERLRTLFAELEKRENILHLLDSHTIDAWDHHTPSNA